MFSSGVMFRTPSVCAHHQLRRSSIQCQFSSGNFACAEFVFQTIDLDVSRAALFVARLDVEKRESATAGWIALRPRERECDLRSYCRRKPFAAVKTKPAHA